MRHSHDGDGRLGRLRTPQLNPHPFNKPLQIAGLDDLDDLDDQFVIPPPVTHNRAPTAANLRMMALSYGHCRTFHPLTLFALCKHGCPGPLSCA
jgi:hypothetical protein